MCIVFVAFQMHPEYPLIVASNRDEFFERQTEPAHHWHPEVQGVVQNKSILAGKDLEGNGTWLGMEKQSGRFAVLTNVRKPESFAPTRESRGHLVTQILTSPHSIDEEMATLAREHERFNPYNLFVATPLEACFFSCTEDAPRSLQPGIYALSNATLDTPWPKIKRGKERFAQLLKTWNRDVGLEPLFQLLKDETRAPDDELPQTGVPIEWERLLSSIFIRDERQHYGTRQSTVVLVNNQFKAHFRERTFNRQGNCEEEHAFCLNMG